jgi:2-polyprenyl-6-methoxyphenol hydroxylase-like FAD-dependent oxidoreductase
VVIVGAGPAGATLAVLLARAHVPVALVEASRTFSRQFRGEALMPSGVAALKRMGLWPLATSIPQRALGAWSFYVNGRLLFEQNEPMGSAHPRMVVVEVPLKMRYAMIASRAPLGSSSLTVPA